MYRFLLSPKWVASFLLCVLAALVCVRLAHWQLDRLEQKRTINASITAARNAEPVPPGQVLSTSSAPGKRQEYRRIRVTGQYDSAREVLVRNRTLHATLGYYVLTPLRTTDGPVLWVVRGWVAAGPGGATQLPTVGEAPGGTVTLVGRVRKPESGSTGDMQVSGRRLITRVTPDALKAQVNGDRVEVGVDPEAAADAAEIAGRLTGAHELSVTEGTVRFRVPRGDVALPDLLRALDTKSITMRSVQMHRPTLDDVFLTLTGRSLREAEEGTRAA